MWTFLVILLQTAAVLPAPFNLPQTITCPDNNIFVYSNESALDRTPYIFVELHADDLQDCIHKCFGNQFCYSLKYESTAVEPCSLYYFAAYNCSAQKLTQASKINYNGGAITIDCLRCPANGDFVTAPPFKGFTDQTIVAKDSAGHSIISKPLIKEVTNNIEFKLAHEKEASTATSTTTLEPKESRKVVEERVCSGVLKFLSTTAIDLETVDLLLNETTVASGNECARLCFDLKCGFAYYKPSEKMCRFTTNTEEVVDGSTCDVSPQRYDHIVPEDEPSQITCVSCDTREPTQTKTPQRKTESPAHIDFSEDATPTVQPHPLFPSTLYPGSPRFFMKELEAQQEKTTLPVLSHQKDEEHVVQHKDQTTSDNLTPLGTTPPNASGTAGKEVSANSTEPTLTKVRGPPGEQASPSVGRNCLIKFQAQPFSERPAEFNAAFEIELLVDSVELCATRCYQDGCSGAKYDPKAGTCSLAYNGKKFCAKEEVVLHYEAKEVTWLHCVNCYSMKSTSEDTTKRAEPSTSTTDTPEKNTSESVLATTESSQTTGTTTEKELEGEKKQEESGKEEEEKVGEKEEEDLKNATTPTKIGSSKDFQRGCLIKFQATPFDKRPSQFTASFELDLPVDSIELCATRCYQDGCTGAKYDPKSKICSLSYNDKQFCTNAPVVLHYEANNATWLHCVNCYSVKESEMFELLEQHEATATRVPLEETASFEPPVSSTFADEEQAMKKFLPEMGEPGKVSKNGTGDEFSHFQKGCVIKFQARQFSQRPPEYNAEFEHEISVDSVELCATRCYQDGCSGAKFDPKGMSCSLSYNDKQFCTNDEVVLHYTATEPTWIHCVNCYSLKSRTGQQSKKLKNEGVERSTTVSSTISSTANGSHEAPSAPVINETSLSKEELESIFSKGCIVNFQVVELEERPSHFKAAFENSFTIETAELCAFRCYQDGCTGAKFEPESNTCSLSYNDKAFCSKASLVTVARTQLPVFMHCLSCVPHKPTKGEVHEGVEGSGEELDKSNKLPQIEASKDEKTLTATTEEPILTPPSRTSPSEEDSTTAPVSSSTPLEVSEASGEDSLRLAGEETTLSPGEASGDDSADASKLSTESLDGNKSAAAVTPAGVEATTRVSTAGLTADEYTTSLPSESTPLQTEKTASSSVSSRASTTVAEIGEEESTMTTVGQEPTTSPEFNGEKSTENSKEKQVEESVHEGASTVHAATISAERTTQTPTIAANDNASTPALPAKSIQSDEAATITPSISHQPEETEASGEDSTTSATVAETRTSSRFSDKQPLENSKQPKLEESVDEGVITVLPSSTIVEGITEAPTMKTDEEQSSQTLAEQTTVHSEVAATTPSVSQSPGEGTESSGEKSTTPAAAEVAVTTTFSSETSGEEPVDSSTTVEMETSIDEAASTVAVPPIIVQSSTEIPTTQATEVKSFTASLLETNSAVRKVMTTPSDFQPPTETVEPSVEETKAPAVTESTTFSAEASGEESIESSNLPKVETSIGEGTSTVKTPPIIVHVTTEAPMTTTSDNEHITTSHSQSVAAFSQSLGEVTEANGGEIVTQALAEETAAFLTTSPGSSRGVHETSTEEPEVQASADVSVSTVAVPPVTAQETTESTLVTARAKTMTAPSMETTSPAEEMATAPSTASTSITAMTEASGEERTPPASAEETTSSAEISKKVPVESTELPKLEANIDGGASTVTIHPITVQVATEMVPTIGSVGEYTVKSPTESTSVVEEGILVLSGSSTPSAAIAESSGEGPTTAAILPSDTTEESTTPVSTGESTITLPIQTLTTGEETITTPSAFQTSSDISEDSGEKSSTSAVIEETTFSAESSGEKSNESNKMPKLEASTDEGTSTVAVPSIIPRVSTEVSEVSENESFTTTSPQSTLTASEVSTKSLSTEISSQVSIEETTASAAAEVTMTPAEASGEEPTVSNKMPTVEASEDEGKSTLVVPPIIVQGLAETSTAALSKNTSSTTSSLQNTPSKGEVTTTYPPAASTSEVSTVNTIKLVVAEGTTTAAEVSGEMPVESNKLPAEEANMDEGASIVTIPPTIFEAITEGTTTMGEGKLAKVPSPSSISTAAVMTTSLPTASVIEVSTGGTTIPAILEVTMTPAEASGEEPVERNKLSTVEASAGEDTTTVAILPNIVQATTGSTTNTVSEGDLATTPSSQNTANGNKATTTTSSSSSLTPAIGLETSNVENTTAMVAEEAVSSSSFSEASGGEPVESHKQPNIEASVDEDINTVLTPPTTAKDTTEDLTTALGERELTTAFTPPSRGTPTSKEVTSGFSVSLLPLTPVIKANSEESTTPTLVKGVTASVPTSAESSGEEPVESSKQLTVQANIDGGKSTVAMPPLIVQSITEVPTTAVTEGEAATPSKSTRGEEGSTNTPLFQTSTKVTEASGEEDTTSAVVEETTILSTSVPPEASGEAPEGRGEQAKTQSSVDEGRSTIVDTPFVRQKTTETLATALGDNKSTTEFLTQSTQPTEEAATTSPAKGTTQNPTTAVGESEFTTASASASKGTPASEQIAFTPFVYSLFPTAATTAGGEESPTAAAAETTAIPPRTTPEGDSNLAKVEVSLDKGISTMSISPVIAQNTIKELVKSVSEGEFTTTLTSQKILTTNEATTTHSTSQVPTEAAETSGEESTMPEAVKGTTTSVEGSGEETAQSKKQPEVEANLDQDANTFAVPLTAAQETTKTVTTIMAESDYTTKSPIASTSSVEQEVTVPISVSTLGSATLTLTEISVGETTTPVTSEETITPTEEASGEEATVRDKLKNLEANMDGTVSIVLFTTVAAETSSRPPFTTAAPDMEGVLTSTSEAEHKSSILRPLDSSSVDESTSTSLPSVTRTLDQGDEYLINRTIIDQPHKANLPVNVGFVPGSEPDKLRESGEEEEEPERMETTKEPDYEDAVASKELEVTSSSSTTKGDAQARMHHPQRRMSKVVRVNAQVQNSQAHVESFNVSSLSAYVRQVEPRLKGVTPQSSTTEPPIQMVQDLIDALAGGGLNAIFGPPRHQGGTGEVDDKKLGELKKYLPKLVERKRDCSSGDLQFVAAELTDLSTKFEADSLVYSLQHCARICYETGCTLAAFTRFPRPVCLIQHGNATSHCDPNIKLTSSWEFSRIQEVVKLECIKCGQNLEFITQKEQVDITKLNEFSTDGLNTVIPKNEGTTSKCDGRLEFQTLPVGSLPRLNITNDVPARTPADCAKKCFEMEGCSTAGFITSSSGNISQGVCLLTSDISFCGNNADYVPQHAALNPFVISCIRCSSCTYNLRAVTPDRVLPDFTHVESVMSAGECAEACHTRRCTMAQYNSQQHSCTMTSEPMESHCAREVPLVVEGVLPVTLECVSCFS